MGEFWDIYTANRVKTGRVMERGSLFKQGDYHLVVHICLFNDRGEMLIQQRQAESWMVRTLGCNCWWECACG